jgi:hypothetical protein
LYGVALGQHKTVKGAFSLPKNFVWTNIFSISGISSKDKLQFYNTFNWRFKRITGILRQSHSKLPLKHHQQHYQQQQSHEFFDVNIFSWSRECMEVLWNIPNNASDNLFTSSEEKVKHLDRDVEQRFSTAGTRPGTGTWRPLYRDLKSFKKNSKFTNFNLNKTSIV